MIVKKRVLGLAGLLEIIHIVYGAPGKLTCGLADPKLKSTPQTLDQLPLVSSALV